MKNNNESQEMYLVTAIQLTELGENEPIPLSLLAKELSILPVSTNQMVHKLSEAGYVKYLPYKGVEVLPKGRRLAYSILRRRRLWELFLTKYLSLSPIEADELACRLEHITPEDVAERLYIFLEEPSISLHGMPIASSDKDIQLDHFQPLSQLSVGRLAEVIRLETDSITTTFLQTEGFLPGVVILVKAVGARGTILLQVGEHLVSLTTQIAENVLIKECSENLEARDINPS